MIREKSPLFREPPDLIIFCESAEIRRDPVHSERRVRDVVDHDIAHHRGVATGQGF